MLTEADCIKHTSAEDRHMQFSYTIKNSKNNLCCSVLSYSVMTCCFPVVGFASNISGFHDFNEGIDENMLRSAE